MNVQRRGISSRNMPKLAAFVQGGYGNPGLNMFRNEFTPFAIGGVRLSWNFGGLYTLRNDIRKVETGIKNIELQREIFLFNNDLQYRQQRAELDKYSSILADDDRIVTLRGNIRRSSEAKVENGTMNVTDLVRDMNAEQNAISSKAIHETELLQAIYRLKNLKNN